MPLNANEEALLGQPSDADLEHEHQRLVRAPGEDSKLGKWSLVALILNRSIGSGIFLNPARILQGTGCVGGALLSWTLACLVSLCGLYVWLECGLSMPQRRVRGEAEPRGVPRSGGEKNFLEFMFPNANLRLPHIRTTCSFAIMYILMYNLGGNAIAFGLQVMSASGRYQSGETPSRGPVLGIAVGILTFVILLHSFSRRSGILINNVFAIVKVGLLLTMFCLGLAKAAGRFGGSSEVARNNFTKDVFKTHRTDVSSWSNSLLLCMYAISGWKQPFYVLAEVKSPRKYLPKYTVLAWLITAVLYLLVNIAYLLVVDKNDVIPATKHGIPESTDLATLFFTRLFGEDNSKAPRAMAALIAFSIFGNLWVTTFTAARIKQEVAKEGILPKSLYIASTYRTPYGLLRKWLSKTCASDEDVERAPSLAFVVHWLSSILLVVVTAPIADPRTAYYVLTSLYAYSINTLIGCWVAVGLIMVKVQRSKWHWQERRRYRPWISPVHVVVFAMATGFILIANFMPPTRGSPYHQSATGLPWYIVPAIGLTAPLWGIVWYWGLQIHEWRIGRQLTVTREAYWAPDPDYPSEYVQKAEIVDLTWQIAARDDMSEDFPLAHGGLHEFKGSFASERPIRMHSQDSSRIERHGDGRQGATQSPRVPTTSSRRLSDSFD